MLDKLHPAPLEKDGLSVRRPGGGTGKFGEQPFAPALNLKQIGIPVDQVAQRYPGYPGTHEYDLTAVGGDSWKGFSMGMLCQPTDLPIPKTHPDDIVITVSVGAPHNPAVKSLGQAA